MIFSLWFKYQHVLYVSLLLLFICSAFDLVAFVVVVGVYGSFFLL